MLHTKDIQAIIPHRYPFLLVDRIIELEPGKRAVGIKNVSGNEPFFQGHFPGNPIMPGVLVLEALAQVGACAILSQDSYKSRLAYFAGIDRVRFKRMVFPGDQLVLEVEMLKLKGLIGKAKGKATVEGDLVAAGEFMFALESKRG
ncbi:MAG: 3-hydroxyacyl-ACP dehydratase FabZ [Syntrophomonadaceae bacterium]|nr:3-hydroxyacyl-ACP dehydratase FabZ [Syntrophomonadaceae bacterium]